MKNDFLKQLLFILISLVCIVLFLNFIKNNLKQRIDDLAIDRVVSVDECSPPKDKETWVRCFPNNNFKE